MLKTVLYYPMVKDLLNFSNAKFKLIYELFPQIKFIYAESVSQFEREIIDADYILTAHITTEQYVLTKKLKAIFCYAAGKEGISPVAIKSVRCYFGHFHGQLMAESLLSAILYFNQQFPLILDQQKKKLWCQPVFSRRNTLVGQKIAFVGYGTIGSYCAQLVSKLGMQAYAIQRTFRQGQCEVSGAKYVHVQDIDTILPQLDHIVSILPYAEDTINYFNVDFFAKLSPHCYFYNIGRGHAVNEHDLLDALNGKIIAGAMLDVFSTEPLPETSALWAEGNLLITPHVSAFYHNYVDLYLDELVHQINDELKL